MGGSVAIPIPAMALHPPQHLLQQAMTMEVGTAVAKVTEVRTSRAVRNMSPSLARLEPRAS